MNKKKKLTLICICLLASLTGVFTYFTWEKPKAPIEWHGFAPQNARFNIQFPKDPVETSQEITIANKRIPYRQFSSQLESTSYTVSFLDFPGHWKLLGTNKLLTKAFDMFLKNEKNVEGLLEKQLSKHNGFSSLNYRIKQDGKEIEGKFIIAGNTLYRITVSYSQTTENTESATFLNSFHIRH